MLPSASATSASVATSASIPSASEPLPSPRPAITASLPLRFLLPDAPPGSVSGEAAAAPSVRHLRHWNRPCCACESVTAARIFHSQRCAYSNAELSVMGVAYYCVECACLQSQPYQLCAACYAAGPSHHQHPDSHTLLPVQPPPPPPQGGPRDWRDFRQSASTPPWYTTAGGSPGEWSWDGVLVQPSQYEELVFDARRDVLVGFWNNKYEQTVGVHALVAAYIPFLARLLARAAATAPSAPRGPRCLLYVESLNGHMQRVDGEWLEWSMDGPTDMPLTLGALIQTRGGCLLSRAAPRAAFLPVQQRDRVYTGWYPDRLDDDAAAFLHPFGSSQSHRSESTFERWLSWVHSSLSAHTSAFDLSAVRQLAASYASQLKAIERAAGVLQQLQSAQRAPDIVKAYLYSEKPDPMYWHRLLYPQYDPRTLVEPLAVLHKCAGPFVAVEDVDVAAVEAALAAVTPVVALWAEKLSGFWYRMPAARQLQWEAKQQSGGRGDTRLVAASGHSAIRSRVLPTDEQVSAEATATASVAVGRVAELTAERWEEVVGNRGAERDVLVAYWGGRMSINSYFHALLSAFSRLLQQHQSQHSDHPASSHGGSLHFAILHTHERQQLDPNFRWLPYDVVARHLHSQHEWAAGCLVLYGAGGSSFNSADCRVYEESDLASSDSERALNYRNLLLRPLLPPTLHDLIRFVHGGMRGGNFDLTAVLQLADETGMQRASQLYCDALMLSIEWQRARYSYGRLLGDLEAPLVPDMMLALNSLPNWDDRLEDMDVEAARCEVQPFEERLRQVRPGLQAAERRLLDVDRDRRQRGEPDCPPAAPHLLSPVPTLVRCQAYLRDTYPDGVLQTAARLAPPKGWTAADVLCVLDCAAYEQHGGLGRWPVYQSRRIAARMTAFHIASAADPVTCTGWALVFQEFLGSSLRLTLVAPASTCPGSPAMFPRRDKVEVRPLDQLVVHQALDWQHPHHLVEPLLEDVRVASFPPPPAVAVNEPAGTGPSREYVSVKIGQEAEWYAARGVRLCNPPQIEWSELYEALLFDHRDSLLIGEAELRRVVEASVVLRGDERLRALLTADDWHHGNPSEATDMPGQSTTFRTLAHCIAHGDDSSWRALQNKMADARQTGSTHRRRWPCLDREVWQASLEFFPRGL